MEQDTWSNVACYQIMEGYETTHSGYVYGVIGANCSVEIEIATMEKADKLIDVTVWFLRTLAIVKVGKRNG